MRNEILNFSDTWGGKLNSKCFTTIRMYNPRKFGEGKVLDVQLKGAFMGEFKVIGHKRLTLNTINLWIAKLDTGYDVESCRNVIRKMYKGDTNFTDDTSLSYVLLERINSTTTNSGKHTSKCFTWIRMFDPKKYAEGKILNIELEGVLIGEFEVIDHKEITLNKINFWIAKLDTGYSVEKCRAEIRKMYMNIENFNDDISLSYVLLEKVKPQ